MVQGNPQDSYILETRQPSVRKAEDTWENRFKKMAGSDSGRDSLNDIDVLK